MTQEERKDAIMFFKQVAEKEVNNAKYSKLAIEALQKEPCEIHLNCTDEEIANSFIEDVGAVKDQLEKQYCDDAISRQAVLDIDFERIILTTAKPAEMIEQKVKALLPVTPQPKIGRWDMCEDADGIYGVCSVCGQDTDFSHYGKAYKYCPSCGIKMESEKV